MYKKKGYKGRNKGAKNRIRTDKSTHGVYCTNAVWEEAVKKCKGKLSQVIEEFLRQL